MQNPYGRLAISLERRTTLAKRALFRAWMRFTGDDHPSSYPYVGGDSFRALADHIHDDTSVVEPSAVKAGDIVFVKNELVLPYLKTAHREIRTPYVLICHNSDESIDKTVADLLDERIVRFYAQDAVYEHPKITPIPIGIEPMRLYAAGVTSIYTKLRKRIERKSPVRKSRIFYKFNIRTNPEERGAALQYFSTHPLMDTVEDKLAPALHAKLLTTYAFIASPPGHAIESCRTWEALYLKTVPIVKDFFAMRHFASLGLPLWIVKDWRELDGLTEADLKARYDSFMQNAKWDALHMDFWIKQIRVDQEKARANA